MLKKNFFLDVGITNDTEDKILEYILQSLKDAKKKLFIVTPNPEILVYAHRHLAYKDKLNKAEVSLPDGVGVFIAAGLLGKRLQERIPGVDFMEYLCLETREKPVSMGFLGGKSGVAERTAKRLKEKYPWIKVAFVGEEWEDSEAGGERGGPPSSARSDPPAGGERGRRMGVTFDRTRPIDILFVAYGFPKQEEWIYEHLEGLPVKVAMGVGGAFDYLSGDVPRAPYLIRAMGMEWLFRLIRQPWRIKRQLALFEFIWLVLQRLMQKR